MRIPGTYDKDQPRRWLFAFHGNGGGAEDIDGSKTSGYTWSYCGLREQAGNSTIFVVPQGNGWANPGGAELKLVDDMVALIEGDLRVDTTRIFAIGFSSGDGMSYALACARAKVYRAVAAYSGAQLGGGDGGRAPSRTSGFMASATGHAIPPADALRDKFVANNACTSQNPPEPKAGSLTHTSSSSKLLTRNPGFLRLHGASSDDSTVRGRPLNLKESISWGDCR